jgi:nitrogen regulatory protein PII
MKEVRAYVRATIANHVVEALVRDGFLTFSILEVRGIADGVPHGLDFSIQLGDRYVRMLKFEIVCRDERAERVVEIVRAAAHTGHTGDGLVVIAPIDDAVRISTGIRGPDAIDPLPSDHLPGRAT